MQTSRRSLCRTHTHTQHAFPSNLPILTLARTYRRPSSVDSGICDVIPLRRIRRLLPQTENAHNAFRLIFAARSRSTNCILLYTKQQQQHTHSQRGGGRRGAHAVNVHSCTMAGPCCGTLGAPVLSDIIQFSAKEFKSSIGDDGARAIPIKALANIFANIYINATDELYIYKMQTKCDSNDP